MRNRNATIRHLRAFFRWTIKRDWRDGDPTDHIDKTREIDDAISILSVPQGFHKREVLPPLKWATPLR